MTLGTTPAEVAVPTLQGEARAVELSDLTHFAAPLRHAIRVLGEKSRRAASALAWTDCEAAAFAADELTELMVVLGMGSEVNPVGEQPRPEVED